MTIHYHPHVNAYEKKRKGTSSYGRLVRYLTDPQRHKQKHGGRERVIAVRSTNLYNDMVHDPEYLEDAIWEVEHLQSRNTRAKERTLHLLLTFREDLELETLAEIEQRVVDYLGYGEHQRISVVHGDKEHLHVHIAINKVYRAKDNQGGDVFLNRHPDFGHMKLARICGVLEREYGLEPDNRTAKQWWDDHRPSRSEEEAAARAALRDGWMDEAKLAGTWAELLEISEAHGVELKAMGKGGLRMVTEHGSIAAGKLGRGFRRGELEQRLGPMPSSRTDQKAARCPARPLAARVKHLAGAELRDATTWGAVHAIAERHGLRLLQRGGGIAFEDLGTGELTSASSVHNGLSLGRAEARLGPYQPAVQSPMLQLREAVVARSEAMARHEYQMRRKAISSGARDPGHLRRWLAESRRVLAADREVIREVHAVGYRLETSPPSDWQRIEQEAPSALAVFRAQATAIWQKFPALAPVAQEHLSQHLYEEQVRTLGSRRHSASLVRPSGPSVGRRRASLVPPPERQEREELSPRQSPSPPTARQRRPAPGTDGDHTRPRARSR